MNGGTMKDNAYAFDINSLKYNAGAYEKLLALAPRKIREEYQEYVKANASEMAGLSESQAMKRFADGFGSACPGEKGIAQLLADIINENEAKNWKAYCGELFLCQGGWLHVWANLDDEKDKDYLISKTDVWALLAKYIMPLTDEPVTMRRVYME